MMSQTIGKVLVASTAFSLDKYFDYLIPDQLVASATIGARVVVPFQNRLVSAYLWEITHESNFENLKEIKEIIDQPSLIADYQIQLINWIADYYYCNRSEVARLCLPPGTKRKESSNRNKVGPKIIKVCQWTTEQTIQPESSKENKIYQILTKNECGLTRTELAAAAEVSPSVITRLIKNGKIYLSEKICERQPAGFEEIKSFKKVHLNQEQQEIYRQINEDKHQSFFLLHGVTGSGKTEIYFELAEDTLNRHKQVLYLVPEIALTPQTLQRARNRFGDRVALLHSNMSDGERYDQWHRIKRGEAQFILGARSALFAPFQNLGLIIMDEEHENTYKQEESPRYHGRQVAEKLSELTGARVVFGSATPAIESFFAAQNGKYRYFKLSKRYNQNPLPSISIIDMREELKKGNRNILSETLHQSIQESLDRREQVILLLNRRGHSTFILCRDCGKSLHCPSCDVSLTYHSNQTLLRCHYCDYQQKVPNLCPHCQSSRIRYFGHGTQKLEAEIEEYFGSAKIMRMDLDTTSKKGAHHQIYQSLISGDVDILLGTQMIAKGLDLPRVTLVGVISADSTLNVPDFRAAERCFQLLTQVAGRAGRGERVGKVIFQTYNPAHYALALSQNHDYESFYQTEIENRMIMTYPPFSELVKIGFSGPNQAKIVEAASEMGRILQEELKEISQGLNEKDDSNLPVEILGPAPALIEKIQNRFRWQIILKSSDSASLDHLIHRSWEKFAFKKYADLRVIRDRNPYSIL